MKHRYLWAGILAFLLISSGIYTLLDAMVIPKAYAAVETKSVESMAQESQTVEENGADGEEGAYSEIQQENGSEAVITANSYQDENISITVTEHSENGTVYYVADIQLSSVEYLKTALAENTFGKNVTEKTSEMAEEHQAILAINGDYYGYRDTGLIIRNGVLYRDTARVAPDNQALTVDAEGDLAIVTEGETEGSELLAGGILQSFSFGPALIEDGAIANLSTEGISQKANPRTAIGQIGTLHYVFVVVDGRSAESGGMTLSQLANVMQNLGCTTAYNLDGGGSSTLWFNGAVANNPSGGRKSSGERSVSDILYIGYQ